jgi:hypothetical protein
MPTSFLLSLGASAALLVVCVAMHFYGLRRQQRDAYLWPLLGGVLLLFLLWLPTFSAYALGLFLFVASMAAGGPLTGLVVVGLFALGVYHLPGGALMTTSVLFVLVMALLLQDARAHLARLERVGGLEAGRTPDKEVGLGAVVTQSNKLQVPGVEKTLAAAWWMRFDGERQSTSGELVPLRWREGLALLDPRGAELEIVDTCEKFEGEKARQLANEFGFSPKDKDDLNECHVYWLRENDSLYLVGRPQWESSPLQASYRGSALAPVFRSGEPDKVWVANKSDEQVHNDAKYALVSWLVWGAVFVGFAVVSTQIL